MQLEPTCPPTQSVSIMNELDGMEKVAVMVCNKELAGFTGRQVLPRLSPRRQSCFHKSKPGDTVCLFVAPADKMEQAGCLSMR
eukprot:scaffold60614_cov17-Tisochrysis_lutea.AAC.1